MAGGHEIALMVGPPGKSKGKSYGSDDAEEEGESGGEEEAEVNAAEEFQDAVKNGSPEDVAKAFKQLMDVCG